MSKFYFTYGSDGHPFYGGWTEVVAPNETTARSVFKLIHPSDNGFLPCSSIYSEEDFRKTSMYLNGNRGCFCHETITLLHKLNNEKE